MLLQSKLYAPSPPHGTIARPRLVNQLTGPRGGSVALIVAPAGYGKTTLISQWLSDNAAPHAWLSLERADSDVSRCARYLYAALSPILPELDARQGALDAGGLGPRDVADALIAALSKMKTPARLVLDDYHTLDESCASHALFAYLAEHAPEGLSLVVTSRSIPPWPCGRLRARGRLLEIGAEALRFSPSEVSALFSARGIRVSRAAAGQLAERTEGWAVGLVLSTLLMRQAGHAAASTRSSR